MTGAPPPPASDPLQPGTARRGAADLPRAPRLLVFDSGLGGLSVLSAIRALRPDVDVVYLADTAVFPIGSFPDARIVARVCEVVGRAIAEHAPDLAVIACNTASTLVLPPLRATHGIAFVGTVPAIKPASATTRSGMFSVLATPGTVRRDYTRALIDTYAFHRDVTLVGAPRLASLAEAALRGEAVADAAFAGEIAPAFVARDGRRTDTVVLGCTHYPLVADRLAAVAPWPVTWIDPAPAIARRVASLLPPAAGVAEGRGLAIVTRPDEALDALAPILAPFGLSEVASTPHAVGA